MEAVMRRNKATAVCVALLAVITGAVIGCGGTQPPRAVPKYAAPSGAWERAELVGKGQKIMFTAPSDGFVYVVIDGQVHIMRPLAKGEQFYVDGQAFPALKFDYCEVYFEPARLKEPQTRP